MINKKKIGTKVFLCITLICTIILSCSCSKKPEKLIIGTWTWLGTMDNFHVAELTWVHKSWTKTITEIVFYEDGSCEVELMDDFGKQYELENTYERLYGFSYAIVNDGAALRLTDADGDSETFSCQIEKDKLIVYVDDGGAIFTK